MLTSLTRLRFTAAALLTLTVVLLACTVLDATGVGRVALTVLFGLTAPGWAVVAFLPAQRPSIEWSLAVSLSLAVAVVISVLLLLVGFWHPAGAMLVLELVTAGALVRHLLRPTQPAAPTAAPTPLPSRGRS